MYNEVNEVPRKILLIVHENQEKFIFEGSIVCVNPFSIYVVRYTSW